MKLLIINEKKGLAYDMRKSHTFSLNKNENDRLDVILHVCISLRLPHALTTNCLTNRVASYRMFLYFDCNNTNS